jgi:hypothetical protein
METLGAQGGSSPQVDTKRGLTSHILSYTCKEEFEKKTNYVKKEEYKRENGSKKKNEERGI